MNKRTLVIGLVVALVLANIAVFVFLFVNNKKAQVQTALVARQEEEREKKEKELKEEREAVEKGWIKMISGDVVRFDGGNRSFVVDIDPLGKHQEYEIAVSDDTVFEKLLNIQNVVEEETTEEGTYPEDSEAEIVQTESSGSTFSELEKGMFVQVHFAERLDLKNAQSFVAQKVVIMESQIN